MAALPEKQGIPMIALGKPKIPLEFFNESKEPPGIRSENIICIEILFRNMIPLPEPSRNHESLSNSSADLRNQF